MEPPAPPPVSQGSLLEGEPLFRLVFDEAPMGAVLTDLDLRLVRVNAEFCRFLGYSVEELLTLRVGDFTHPDDLEEDLHQARQLAAGIIDQFQMDKRYLRKDKSVAWGRLNVRLIHEPTGRPCFCLAFIEDITARKQAEEALRRFELLARHSRDIVLFMNHEDGRILEANEAAIQAYGYSREELLRLTIHDLRAEATRPQTTGQMAIADTEGILFETLHRRKDGQTFPVEVNSQGTIVEGVHTLVSVVRDITERKRAEENLRTSEERFRKIFEHAATGIAIVHWEGRFLECNPAFSVLLGYSQEELRQMHFSALLHPEDRIDNLSTTDRLKSGKVSFFENESRYIRKDGQAVWVHKFVSILPSEQGPPRVMVLATDITQRRRTEETLQQAKAAAEAANQAKDQFLAVLSHELRTPLSPALMLAGMQANNCNLPDDVRQDLKTIHRNIELETRIIDDLLDLSRVTNGKMRMLPRRVSAHEVLRRALQTCAADLAEHHLQIHQDLSASCDCVQADPARLQQVFWNLLKNAAKFTPDGGSLFISSRTLSDGQLQVQVRDTGIGIAPGVLQRIFSAFEQGDQNVTRQFGGLGLGLAISKAIVELQGGTIRAESPGEGGGSTFTVELPTAASHSASSTDRPFLPPSPLSGAGLRLLIAEDHADTARTLARLLRASGHYVQTAEGVAAALACLAEGRFDLLISDLGLSDGSGYELMRQAKSGYGIIGICMSGYGMETDIEKSRQAGFVAHLTKPISFEHLEQTIQQVLRGPEAAQGRQTP